MLTENVTRAVRRGPAFAHYLPNEVQLVNGFQNFFLCIEYLANEEVTDVETFLINQMRVFLTKTYIPSEFNNLLDFVSANNFRLAIHYFIEICL